MEKKFTILNEEGLHARPVGAFVKVASTFKSDIQITANGITKNGKSIMGLMSLDLNRGSEILLSIKGPDEKMAMEKVEQLINNRFQL